MMIAVIYRLLRILLLSQAYLRIGKYFLCNIYISRTHSKVLCSLYRFKFFHDILSLTYRSLFKPPLHIHSLLIIASAWIAELPPSSTFACFIVTQ